jgi:hypothetical protein
MSNVQIRVIEDQHIEDKVVNNPNEVIQEYLTKNGANQNPFIDEEDQIKSYLNTQSTNNQYRFAPKPGDRLTNREVKSVNVDDQLNIQIEIRMDMPSNR